MAMEISKLNSKKNCQRISLNSTKRFSIIRLCSILLVLTLKSANGLVASADNKHIGEDSQSRMVPAEVYPWNIAGLPDFNVENNMLKRSSWQKLHGSWGKRSSDDEYSSNLENFNEANNLIGESVETDNPADNDYQELIKFEEIYSLPASVVNELVKPSLINERKRAWRNLNVAWGKRRSNNDWNKFRGAWGKREPGWNNLKGLWGKRSTNWNKLNSAWGKRSTNDDLLNSSN